jgi:Sulfotransferase family
MNIANKLFITGTSRSGTTTMANFMRCDSRILMGREKHNNLIQNNELSENLFSKERFCFGFSSEDSHHSNEDSYYPQSAIHYHTAAYIGDKFPNLFEYYDDLFRVFPRAKIIYMIREISDVALSFEKRAIESQELKKYGEYNSNRMWPIDRGYKAAVNEWNESLERTKSFIGDERFFIVNYSDLYQNENCLFSIYEFLDLKYTAQTQADWNHFSNERRMIEGKKTGTLQKDQLAYVMKHSNYEDYNKLLLSRTIKD